MRVAFFCSTPYQILIAINMKEKVLKDSYVDIYILDHFKGSKTIANNLAKEKLFFSRVQYVEYEELKDLYYNTSRFRRYYEKIKGFMNYNKISKVFFDFEDLKYDEVYLSSPDTLIHIAIKYLYKVNPLLKINLFEDGIASYSDSFTKPRLIKELFNFFTGTYKIIDHYDSLWLLNPELYEGDFSSENIMKIPPMGDDIRTNQNISKVFGFSKQQIIKEGVIFFEQLINQFDGLDSNKLYSTLSEVFKDEFILKLHPRTSLDNSSETIKTYNSNNIPWEIIALNSNISDKILIAHFSTTLISNKIIFDEEPYLIFLYDLEELKKYYELSNKFVLFVEKFRKTYRKPSRIFVPKSIPELKKILNELSKDINN